MSVVGEWIEGWASGILYPMLALISAALEFSSWIGWVGGRLVK